MVRTLLLVLCLLPIPAGSAAASPQNQSPVPEAERLRNAGQFQEAARLLEAHISRHPYDPVGTRLLAQTLYWLHERARARELYEAALLRHPDDTRIALDYGRMLLETGERHRARAVISPLLSSAEARGDASALLGTLAYWEGDLAAAERLFTDAIAAGAGGDEVRRQLRDIRILSAPWVRVSPTVWHDDQPLDRTGVVFETGWFLTALVPVQIRIEPQHYGSAQTEETAWSGDIRLAAYLPRARMDVETAAGFLRRSNPQPATDWTGRVAAGPRLPHGVTIRGRVERAAYFHTTASLRTPVTSATLAGQIRWDDPRGWLGEAEHRRQRFFDGNVVRITYAWLLMPFVRANSLGLQGGYAFATSDSDELRFVPDDGQPPSVPQEPGVDTAGRYDPYHTPVNQVTHSIIAAVRLSSSGGTTVRASGSYALRASEDFPSVTISGGELQTVIGRRDFTPWTGRGSIDFRMHEGWTLSVSGETGRGAFYRWATAGVHLTYRFFPDDSVVR